MKSANPIKLYNTPEEVGVRLMFILNASKSNMSLERIQVYDHLLLHLSDVQANLISVHPSNPSHSSEIAVKRQLIQEALLMLVLKGLITVKYLNRGVFYCANQITQKSLQTLTSKYSKHIDGNAQNVCGLFSQYGDVQLQKHIYKIMRGWVGEIEKTYSVEVKRDE